MAHVDDWLQTADGSEFDPNPDVDWLKDFVDAPRNEDGDIGMEVDASLSGEQQQQPGSVDSAATSDAAGREGHLIRHLADALREWKPLEDHSTGSETRNSIYNSLMACYIYTSRPDYSSSEMIFTKPLFDSILESLKRLPEQLRSDFYTDQVKMDEWLHRVKSCTTSFRELSEHIEWRCRNDFGELGEPVMALLDTELGVKEVDEAIAAHTYHLGDA